MSDLYGNYKSILMKLVLFGFFGIFLKHFDLTLLLLKHFLEKTKKEKSATMEYRYFSNI